MQEPYIKNMKIDSSIKEVEESITDLYPSIYNTADQSRNERAAIQSLDERIKVLMAQTGVTVAINEVTSKEATPLTIQEKRKSDFQSIATLLFLVWQVD